MNSQQTIVTALLLLILGLSACAEHRPHEPKQSSPAAAARVIDKPVPSQMETVEKLGGSQLDDNQAPSVQPVEQVDMQRALIEPAARHRSLNAVADELQHPWLPPQPVLIDRENYLPVDENSVRLVAENPVSTFSIDVDTAAYSNIRRMLQREGRLPPRDAVRIEEMINYFNYDYPQPSAEQAFSVTTEVAPAPWHPQRQLLHIGLQAYEPAREQRPAANLVFLVDVSGSMRQDNKLELVKKSLRLLTRKLSEQDRIALVVYAGAAGLVLESTPANEQAKIMQAIDGLSAGGSTNGSAGIQLAYQQAQQHFIKDGINRVLITSDGDLNVGTVNLRALKHLIAKKRQTGISLTTLGFGTGNYNYSLMEQLADHGNGNAAYIDNLQEAQKVLVEELQSTLLTIASDVKIQIEFNPHYVAEYRLIGYENRLLEREDFNNDKVDAGEIGAGHSVTALYEITATNSAGRQIDPLRYTSAQAETNKAERLAELAYVRLRYKQANAASSIEVSQPIRAEQSLSALDQASANLRFAASVAGFGALLRGGKYSAEWDYDDALNLARSARGNDPHGYRGEFIRLVELAQSLDENRS